ncbi:50S ribosomal protein L32 [Candidatus Sumerlaeota bacterium]|nr:50S ribosomal protein L32 [Candidatus Sumerlaeota bacterium]
MPTPRRRHSRARSDKRRSHLKMKEITNVSKCENCGEPKLPHRACKSCGQYKGKSYRVVVHS